MGLTDDIALGARRLRRAVVLALLALTAGVLDAAAGGLDRRLRAWILRPCHGARSASCKRLRRIFARPVPEAWSARRWC
jgi:hypothetical protein